MEFLVAWGGAEDDAQEVQRAASMEELDSVLDSIELSAMQGECIYQVDLCLTYIGADDPIMIQFLIGHPERSSLIWHEDGTTMIAVEEAITPLGDPLRCQRAGRSDYIEPNLTMITPATVRDTLSIFVLTHRRPDNLNWIEAEQD